jgi:hypothetical protein
LTCWQPRRWVHPPGSGVVEHALTYGHLLDELLCRPTGEPLVERFARVANAAAWGRRNGVACGGDALSITW